MQTVRYACFMFLALVSLGTGLVFPQEVERYQMLTGCGVEFLQDNDRYYQCTWSDSGKEYKVPVSYEEFNINVNRINDIDVRMVEHPFRWVFIAFVLLLCVNCIVEIGVLIWGRVHVQSPA